jgi:excisionase family DNA binding protein
MEEKMTEILTKTDVATEFKLPKRTIDYLVATGQIPFLRLGKRTVRFSRESLAQWIKDRENIKVEYHK